MRNLAKCTEQISWWKVSWDGEHGDLRVILHLEMLGVEMPKSIPTPSAQADVLPRMFCGPWAEWITMLASCSQCILSSPPVPDAVFFYPLTNRSWNLVAFVSGLSWTSGWSISQKQSVPEARTDRHTTNYKCRVQLFLKRISNDLLLAVDCGMCAEWHASDSQKRWAPRNRFSKIFETWNHVRWSSMLGWHQEMPPFGCTIGLVQGPIHITQWKHQRSPTFWKHTGCRTGPPSRLGELRHIHRCNESSLKQWGIRLRTMHFTSNSFGSRELEKTS